jgi:autotransporter-associated beta strand protein
MTLTLGAAGGVSVGGSHVVSWIGKGPKKIILGSGKDQVTLAPGYDSVEIDFGSGGSTVEILTFEPDTTVSLVGLNPQEKNSLNVCALAATSLTVSADGLTTSDGSRIAMDVSHLRKLTFHDPAADVVLDFGGIAPQRLQVSARTAAIVSALEATDVRITGAEGVQVEGLVTAASGGSVLLATTRRGAAVTIGRSAPSTITASHGNIAIMGSELVIGEMAQTPFTISGGGLDNKAKKVSAPVGWRLAGNSLVFEGIDVPKGQTVFLNAANLANDQLVKSGEGTLVVTRASSHAGGTFVEAGTLYIRHVGAFGTGPVSVAAGATVVLDVGFDAVEMGRLTLAEGATLTQITPNGQTSSEAAFTLTSQGTWQRLFNTGSELVASTFAQWSPDVDWQFPVIADFNGDGLPDVAAMTPTGMWWAAINRGDGTGRNVRMTGWSGSAGWTDVVSGDFNGDGRGDIAGRTATGGWWVAQSRPILVGFTNSLFAQWSTGTTWRDVVAGDFNADGRTDIAGRAANGAWWAALATASGQAVNTRMGRWAGDAFVDVAVGDVNGDGRSDIIGRSSDGNWWAAVSSAVGTSFSSQFMARWNPSILWQDVRFGDIDGNGRTDVVGRTQNGQWWAAFARDTSVGYDSVPLGAWNPTIDWKSVVLGDFNFDGRLDIAGIAPDTKSSDAGTWWAGLTRSSGIDNKLWGQFGLASGEVVRKTLSTTTR